MATNLLERILEYVEDMIWFAGTSIRVAKPEQSPNFPKSSAVRQALEKGDRKAAHSLFTQLLDWDGYWKEWVNGYTASYMGDVFDWYFESKRVFSISTNLQDLLEATDLPDFLPAETHFVANSFAVKLERPVMLSLGGKERPYDLIVCTRDPQIHNLQIHAYPAALYDYKRLLPVEKQKLEAQALAGKNAFANRTEGFLEDSVEFGAIMGFSIRVNPDETRGYRQIIEEDAAGNEAFLKVFQLALGTNLYVQTERGGDSEVHEKVPLRRTERGMNVMAEADIFTLTSSYMLHKQSMADGDGTGGGGMPPHFRRGYWRRPRGQGQIPDAKRTEWVRPTWVHADRIAKGEVPLGAMQRDPVKV